MKNEALTFQKGDKKSIFLMRHATGIYDKNIFIYPNVSRIEFVKKDKE